MKLKNIFKKKEDYSITDWLLIKLSAIALALIVIKLAIPYSIIWIYNTSVWWFVSALIIIVALINFKRKK